MLRYAASVPGWVTSQLAQPGMLVKRPFEVAATSARVMMPMHFVASFIPWLKPM